MKLTMVETFVFIFISFIRFCTELFPKFEKFWFPGNYTSNQPGGFIQQPDKYTVQDDFEESIKRNMDIESAYIPKLVFYHCPTLREAWTQITRLQVAGVIVVYTKLQNQ